MFNKMTFSVSDALSLFRSERIIEFVYCARTQHDGKRVPNLNFLWFTIFV